MWFLAPLLTFVLTPHFCLKINSSFVQFRRTDNHYYLYSNEDGAVFEWKNWKLPTLNVKVAKSQNHIFSTSFHLHKNEENYARLNTYFHEFVFRQNCQSTKNRLQDFHFHAFRFCLSCLASVTKVTKPLLI